LEVNAIQTQNTEKVKRGEIYLHDFGDNTGSIQNDFFKSDQLKKHNALRKMFLVLYLISE